MRLRPESAAVLLGGVSIVELSALTVDDALDFFAKMKLKGAAKQIATEVLKEIRARLRFLTSVGLGYLSLDRPGPSLSGGEAQRVRLASMRAQEAQIWLLDEPTNHLDPSLRFELVDTLTRIGKSGVSLVWVTHDLTLIPTFSVPHLTVVGMDEGRVEFALPSSSPELPSRIGALFGVRLETAPSELGPRWFVARGER